MNSRFFHDWQEYHVEQLKSMWGTASAAIIAGHILGDPKKRNAIIGKAHRLGLPRLKNSGVLVCRACTRKVRPHKRPKMVKNLSLEDMRLITIVELRDNTCHWPIGDPRDESFRYCGLPKQSDQGSYCLHHYQKSLACNKRAFTCSAF